MKEPATVATRVHALGSELINWYLVEEDGALTAVDAGLPGFDKRLDADLERLGFAPGDVDAVVLTHSDGDHTGLAPRLQAAGARVLIHADDEATVGKGGPRGGGRSPRNLLPQLARPSMLKILGHNLRHGAARPAKVEGAQTFSDGEVLDVPGRPRVVHTPGHTPGHCALLFESHGVLFAGDSVCDHVLMTRGRGPQTMPSHLNVDHALAVESLAAIGRVEADMVLMGHGDPWRGSPAALAAQARENSPS